MTVTPEDYAQWREHPITEWVLDGLRNYSAAAKAQWQDVAWEGAHGAPVDEAAQARRRTRVEAYADLAGLTFEDAAALHGDAE